MVIEAAFVIWNSQLPCLLLLPLLSYFQILLDAVKMPRILCRDILVGRYNNVQSSSIAIQCSKTTTRNNKIQRIYMGRKGEELQTIMFNRRLFCYSIEMLQSQLTLDNRMENVIEVYSTISSNWVHNLNLEF